MDDMIRDDLRRKYISALAAARLEMAREMDRAQTGEPLNGPALEAALGRIADAATEIGMAES